MDLNKRKKVGPILIEPTFISTSQTLNYSTLISYTLCWSLRV